MITICSLLLVRSLRQFPRAFTFSHHVFKEAWKTVQSFDKVNLDQPTDDSPRISVMSTAHASLPPRKTTGVGT